MLDDGAACCSSTCAASAPATCCSAATRWPSSSPRAWAWSRSSADFTAEALRALARGRKTPVKAFLLTQERIAGVGNIYADEALFRARIHPLRPVGTLKRAQIEALRDAVVEALEPGIDSKGASIDDYRHVDGARGSFQDRFLVHSRAGEPCPRCGTPIEKLRAAGPRHLRLPELPAAAAGQAALAARASTTTSAPRPGSSSRCGGGRARAPIGASRSVRRAIARSTTLLLGHRQGGAQAAADAAAERDPGVRAAACARRSRSGRNANGSG